MSSENTCPICDEQAVSNQRDSARPGLRSIECSRCGRYLLAPSDFIANSEGRDVRYLLSAYLREHSDGIKELIVNDSLIQSVLPELKEYNVERKIGKVLLYLGKYSEYPGSYVSLVGELFPVAYARNQSEFVFYRDHLEERGYIEKKSNDRIRLTAKGWNELYKMRRQGRDSKECFIAMSFREEYDKLYLALQKGVDLAGRGYSAARLDDPQSPELIDNALIAKMKNSRFMIADFSANNAGVYFEAGYMRGLGRHVISTCKKLDAQGKLVDKKGEDLHFDVEHYPTLFWEERNLEKLSEDLANWIIAWGI